MENSFAHKSCRLTGFEFRISYYDETLEFYQKLGFVIHKEIEDATKKSVWFRNQHDQMDENSSFFVFTWNKSDNVLQVMEKAEVCDEGLLLTICTRNIVNDFDQISDMQGTGCWIQHQPMTVVDKEILAGTVIDPNGLTLQFNQFANETFYADQDDSSTSDGSGLHARAWSIKFGDVYVLSEHPERTSNFIERIFSTRKDAGGVVQDQSGNSKADVLDELVSKSTVEQRKRRGIYIVDREEFPTAGTELLWCGSDKRSIASALCLYSHNRRSADISSLGKASTISSKEEDKHLLIGCLVSVHDLQLFSKMIDMHNTTGSDVSRLIEERQKVSSVDMKNNSKVFAYHPIGKIPLKLKLSIPTSESKKIDFFSKNNDSDIPMKLDPQE